MKYEFERTHGIMYLNITGKKIIRIDLRRHEYASEDAFYEIPRGLSRALRPALAEFLKSTNGMSEYDDSDKAIVLALAAKAVKISLDNHDYPSRSTEKRGLDEAYIDFLDRVRDMLDIEAIENQRLHPEVEKFVENEWSECITAYLLIPHTNSEEFADVFSKLIKDNWHHYYSRPEYVIFSPGKSRNRNASGVPTRMGMKCTPPNDYFGTFNQIKHMIEETFVAEGWVFKRAFTTGYYASLRDEITLEAEMPEKFGDLGIQFERNGYQFDVILNSDSRISISPKEFFDLCSEYTQARVAKNRLQAYIDQCREEYDPTFIKGGKK
ncbi:hypothetical protein [Cronobacter phage vB_Cdu_VP8]|nr:hypothetical protein [Cronobacter phage vB_Cdu_VP8]